MVVDDVLKYMVTNDHVERLIANANIGEVHSHIDIWAEQVSGQIF
jgi:hypothetical protein